MLIAVAISGCTEKGPSVADKSAEELKTLSIASAENLTSYSLKSTQNITWRIQNPGNANSTAKTQTIESGKSVDLKEAKSEEMFSVNILVKVPGEPVNSTSFKGLSYKIGNSTYINDYRGQWTHLKDPRPIEDVWGNGSMNDIEAFANRLNASQLKIVGSDKVNEGDAQKMEIFATGSDYYIRDSYAFDIASEIATTMSGLSAQNLLAFPSINSTELNTSSKMEKFVWISKSSSLPLKYQNSLRFTIKPLIIGIMDPRSNQILRLNESMQLGEVSVNVEFIDNFYDFNEPKKIEPPQDALNATAITPTQVQPQVVMPA
jgi:hypothetical protein